MGLFLSKDTLWNFTMFLSAYSSSLLRSLHMTTQTFCLINHFSQLCFNCNIVEDVLYPIVQLINEEITQYWILSHPLGHTSCATGHIRLCQWRNLLPFISLTRFNSRWGLTFFVPSLNALTVSIYSSWITFSCFNFLYASFYI